MQDRSEARKLLKNFTVMVKNQVKKGVKEACDDNGSEFISGSMRDLYHEYGVLRGSSPQ